MASQSPTPPSMTVKPAGPARLSVRLRRLRFALRRDTLAAITAPLQAVRLADELLARTAIAEPDTERWCGVAVHPPAALMHSASPAGGGHGFGWVRNTVSALHDAEPADPMWADVQTAVNNARSTLQAARNCATSATGRHARHVPRRGHGELTIARYARKCSRDQRVWPVLPPIRVRLSTNTSTRRHTTDVPHPVVRVSSGRCSRAQMTEIPAEAGKSET